MYSLKLDNMVYIIYNYLYLATHLAACPFSVRHTITGVCRLKDVLTVLLATASTISIGFLVLYRISRNKFE
jgi:hypothetical protein